MFDYEGEGVGYMNCIFTIQVVDGENFFLLRFSRGTDFEKLKAELEKRFEQLRKESAQRIKEGNTERDSDQFLNKFDETEKNGVYVLIDI